MTIFNPDPTRPPLVVLGKPNPRKDEIEPLTLIGRYMAHLDRVWQTTRSPGVCQIIREAYLRERASLGKQSHMTILPDGSPVPTHKYVLIFTDKKFQQSLDEKIPEWREYHWYTVHNSKDTRETARHFEYMMKQAGISLKTEDDGRQVTDQSAT